MLCSKRVDFVQVRKKLGIEEEASSVERVNECSSFKEDSVNHGNRSLYGLLQCRPTTSFHVGNKKKRHRGRVVEGERLVSLRDI